MHADLFASKIPEPGPSVMRLPVLIENEKSELRVAEGFKVETLVDGSGFSKVASGASKWKYTDFRIKD